MKTLIKRDLLATKTLWLSVLIVCILSQVVIYFLVRGASIYELEQIDAIKWFTLFIISYGVITQLYKRESYSGFIERLMESPVSARKIIFSRYGAIFIIHGTLTVSFVTLFYFFVWLNGLPVSYVRLTEGLFITTSLLLFVVVFYTLMSFGYSERVASRCMKLFWIGLFIYFFFGVSFIGNDRFMIHFITYISYFFLCALVLVLIGSYLTIYMIGLKRRNQLDKKPVIFFIGLFLLLIATSGVVVEKYVELRYSPEVDLKSVSINEGVQADLIVERKGIEVDATLVTTVYIPRNVPIHQLHQLRVAFQTEDDLGQHTYTYPPTTTSVKGAGYQIRVFKDMRMTWEEYQALVNGETVEHYQLLLQTEWNYVDTPNVEDALIIDLSSDNWKVLDHH
ncbi:ABC-2 transporter permease [Bacillus sp. FJAT-45037]|uniref:ABC-2 transporter permease n=1 Tax=Bacillus sp. FJAT-45037 TaxID=2011007 RepID=UPI000C23256D|nr:ABC-2 transporter permease [Bacillus sp. FJAT-45037]